MADFDKYSDRELAETIRKDSPLCDKAFFVLYSRYSEQLNAFCKFKAACDRDAEEVFQDTWVRFHRSVVEGRTPDSVPAYLYTIARNLCVDRYRTGRPNAMIPMDTIDLEKIAVPFNLQGQIEKDDLLSIVSIAVNNLDDKYKEPFVLQWFGGLSFPEIAEIMGETTGCVKMRSHRAMNELIRILKPYIIEVSKEQ